MANQISIKQTNQSGNQYKKDRIKLLGIGSRKKRMLLILLAMIIVYLVCVLIPNPLSYLYDPNMQHNWISRYWADLRANIAGLGTALEPHFYTDYIGLSGAHAEKLLGAFLIMVSGAALSVSGAVYQGSFRNAVASPTTLGVISGGTFGAVLYYLLFYTDNMDYVGTGNPLWMKIFFVCIGCFGAVFFTVCVSALAGRGKLSMVVMIVTGTVFSGAIAAVNELIAYNYMSEHPYEAKAECLRIPISASLRLEFEGTWGYIYMFPTIVLIVLIFLMGKRLNLLALGEDEARMMGINVKRTRRLMVVLCTLLTTSVLATVGSIGFVGLIIPNITRRIVGPDFRLLLPASAMVGAIFLMIVTKMPSFSWLNGADSISPMVNFIGGVVFIYMIMKNRRQRNADWAR